MTSDLLDSDAREEGQLTGNKRTLRLVDTSVRAETVIVYRPSKSYLGDWGWVARGTGCAGLSFMRGNMYGVRHEAVVSVFLFLREERGWGSTAFRVI